ncbi:TetR/AcrR family transcriptional regulator [Streptomyces alboflavus]|uniref:TetR/AcrR family transcriptional regulator n=1 Tax=Streptomyces alboflavus TaxID=67267 RepID=UPI0036C70C43
MTDHLTRSDARDNRARILDAARVVFSEEGLAAPMREVARHADVGPATLYRHFPTKRDLIGATYAEQRRACHAIVRDALADPDPWRGFRRLIEEILELHARSRGFADAFMAAFPEGDDFVAERQRALLAVTDLARRAQRSGHLRSGFVVDDLMLMLMAHQGIQDAPPETRLAASRRFAAYMIEGFRAHPETRGPAPLPPAPHLCSPHPGPADRP